MILPQCESCFAKWGIPDSFCHESFIISRSQKYILFLIIAPLTECGIDLTFLTVDEAAAHATLAGLAANDPKSVVTIDRCSRMNRVHMTGEMQGGKADAHTIARRNALLAPMPAWREGRYDDVCHLLSNVKRS